MAEQETRTRKQALQELLGIIWQLSAEARRSGSTDAVEEIQEHGREILNIMDTIPEENDG